MHPAQLTSLTKPLIAVVYLTATMAAAPCLARDQRDEFVRVSPDGWHFETARTHKPFIPFGGVYFDPATYVDKPYPRFLFRVFRSRLFHFFFGLAEFSTTLKSTIFLTSSIGIGWSIGNWIAPFEVL